VDDHPVRPSSVWSARKWGYHKPSRCVVNCNEDEIAKSFENATQKAVSIEMPFLLFLGIRAIFFIDAKFRCAEPDSKKGIASVWTLV
jgi:hypothetical protein